VSARVGLALAAALLAGVVTLALWPTAKRGAFSGVLSTRRADALGARAFYRVLELAGHEPLRRSEDLEALSLRGVLFSLAPEAPEPPLQGLPRPPVFGKFERREILRWVEAGGRLVLVSSRTTGVHRDFGVRVLEGKGRVRPGVARAVGASPLLGGARELASPLMHHLDLGASDPRTLFAHERRAVVAVVPRGEGLAVFLALPYVAGNAGLRERDNLRFLYSLATLLAGDGRVHFDEYHHGHRRSRGFVALASGFGLQFALAQLALAGLFALWAARHPPRGRAPARDAGRGAEEHIAAVAALYERGGLAAHAAETLWSATRAAVAARLGLRGPRALRALGPALEARGRRDLAVRLRSLERRAGDLGAKVRPRDLVAFARDLADLRRAVAARTSREEARP
jgi:hypothetical protein